MKNLTKEENKICCDLLVKKIVELENEKDIVTRQVECGCDIEYMIDDLENEISDLREIVEKKVRCIRDSDEIIQILMPRDLMKFLEPILKRELKERKNI